MTKEKSGFIKSLGPGLLMAGAAIGVSHLVQSTRAGAQYGFALVSFVILAILFKYPFFEFGPRYTVATGKSLLHGYLSLGKWAMTIFVAFTISTMFIVLAALTLVTAGLAGQLFGIHVSTFLLSVIILLITASISLIGKYPALDLLMKIIIVALAFSTVLAAIIVVIKSPAHTSTTATSIWTTESLFFIVALMGWMPSVIDISVWHSLWSIERQRQTGYRPKMSEALFDFNLGYIGTALLALVFLTLGALVMHGSGESFPNSSVTFAGQFVSLYTKSLGGWTRPLIVIAAFTTMFSTTLVVTDAYPRVLTQVSGLILPRTTLAVGRNRLYLFLLILLVLVSLAVLQFFLNSFKSLIDLATTISFLTTPLLAYINYKTITDTHVPPEHQPGRSLKALSWAGIAFWTAFALVFLYMKLI